MVSTMLAAQQGALQSNISATLIKQNAAAEKSTVLPESARGRTPDITLKLDDRVRSPGQSGVLLQVEKARKQFGGVIGVNN
ncbi:MAG: hypothetical protein JSV48_10910, partial [Bradyrhizobium sp.]